MRLNLAIVALSLAATLGLTAVLERLSPPSLPSRAVARQGSDMAVAAPDFTLQTLDGARVTLGDHRGKVVLLNFWASWCLPCVAEFPQLTGLAQDFPRDIVVLAVSVDDDARNIRAFLRRHGPERLPENFVVLHDRDKKVSQDLYQTVLLPETVILAPDLTLARKIAGADIDWNGDEMKEYLSGLAARR